MIKYASGTEFRVCKKLYAGISLKDEQEVVFNWNHDDSNDVLALVDKTCGEYFDDGVRYIYGYMYNPNAKGSDKKVVRDYMKNIPANSMGLYSENIEEFVENGILHIEDYCPFSDFDVTVYIEPTRSPALIDVMLGYMMEYLHNVHTDFSLIKKAYEDVTFDDRLAYRLLRQSGYSDIKAKSQVEHTIKKFNDLKNQGELFQMKRFIPKEIRGSFTDFLKFKTDEERETYAALQGVNVLAFDDFMTSGNTVREMIKYLKSINNKNTLTVFVLVKQ